MSHGGIIVVTGFEPYGPHHVNPSAELAKAVDGRRFGEVLVRGAVLPVEHAAANSVTARLVAEHDPRAVLHLGLAEGRARVALERVAVNVRDYSLPDAAGCVMTDQPCAPGGPAAYVSTLPLRAMLAALTAQGIPAYISGTAGTYLCNETMYATLHLLATSGGATQAGFMHLPLLPAMVARSGTDQPSMDAPTTLRALEIVLAVIAAGT
jgi:pyroglutamyl-peptidase